MKEYRGEEMRDFIVQVLISHSVGRSSEYEVFLQMQPREALDKLKPRLEELQNLYEKSKGRPHLYFLDELGFWQFLVELHAAEALDIYFNLVIEEKEIPPLVI